MPLAPSDLTTNHLDYTDGRFASAVLEPETRAVSLLPVQLVGFNERRRVGQDVVAVPVFRVPCLAGEHGIAPTAILFEPDELPAVLRDMLWPRDVPSNTGSRGTLDRATGPGTDGVTDVPPFPDAGNIDDEPVPAGSSDYAEPVL